MSFTRVCIFHNPQKPHTAGLAPQVQAWFTAHGVHAGLVSSPDHLPPCDMLVCLGGDGTMLRAARAVAAQGTPLFGINCGTLGFLSACEQEEYPAALTQLLAGNFSARKRSLVRATVFFPDGKTQTEDALNDCVIRSSHPRAFTVQARWNGEELPAFLGDGVIVATPTGSTAYSLAAGGPIVAPGVDVLLLTPVCPHSLHQRPMIIPSGGELELTPVFKNQAEQACLSMDGQTNVLLPPGSRVVFTHAPHPAVFLHATQRTFFSILHHKLNWGAR